MNLSARDTRRRLEKAAFGRVWRLPLEHWRGETLLHCSAVRFIIKLVQYVDSRFDEERFRQCFDGDAGAWYVRGKNVPCVYRYDPDETGAGAAPEMGRVRKGWGCRHAALFIALLGAPPTGMH